ncbi:helix-turn-helix domain-containing protein [Deinococcus peraridilitoris]|uniref:helix-turn-helix domain-containing protein n=1 Tax=Deinococcus peraridilitoris TaxID=432329 RepID=UPI0012F728C3|nr:helix-turn-helix transcriptional regulator [Deinococcus peraridilitoris]
MLRVRLRELLHDNDVSAYRLAQEVKTIKPAQLYAIVRGDRLPSLDTVDDILNALARITKKTFTPNDVLEYEPD